MPHRATPWSIIRVEILARLFDFDSHRPVRWVNLTGKLPEPPHKAPFFTHFAAGSGEVGEKGKRERGTWLKLISQIHRVRRAGRGLVCEIKQSNECLVNHRVPSLTGLLTVGPMSVTS